MKIRKAVITAAGRNQRLLPLQRLVDLDGVEKTALQIIIEEVVGAGIEDVCIVVCPGDQAAYAEAAGSHAGRLSFVEQVEARGYGHAILQARPFTGDDAFLHLVSDHLYVSRGSRRCAKQVVDAASAESCAVLALQATRENMLPYFGAVGGRRMAGQTALYELDTVVEKPTPTEAEQTLMVPGLRAGYYLCLFGISVLTPQVMDLLAEQFAALPADGRLQLSPALALQAQHGRLLGLEVQGDRYNIGMKYGLLIAQLATALTGNDREEILAEMLELLASRRLREG